MTKQEEIIRLSAFVEILYAVAQNSLEYGAEVSIDMVIKKMDEYRTALKTLKGG